MTATGDRSGRDAKWRDPNTGKQRSKTFRLRRDAASYGARMEAAKAEGRYLDPLAGKITFKGHGEGWRERQLHRPRTATEVERMLRLYVYPRIGNKSLGAIRPSEIEALVKACSSTLAPNTIRVLFGWVRSIFRAAVRDRLIAVSPCEGVKLPPAERPKVTPPGPSLVAAMADAIDPRYRALILLGAGSGVRISEALAVSIDRIDFLRRTVTVDRQLLRGSGRVPLFGPVKDRRDRSRTIPLGSVVLDALAEHLAAYGAGPEGLVFTTMLGRPVGHSTWSRVWREAAARLGINKGEGFHQLRHFLPRR